MLSWNSTETEYRKLSSLEKTFFFNSSTRILIFKECTSSILGTKTKAVLYWKKSSKGAIKADDILAKKWSLRVARVNEGWGFLNVKKVALSTLMNWEAVIEQRMGEILRYPSRLWIYPPFWLLWWSLLEDATRTQPLYLLRITIPWRDHTLGRIRRWRSEFYYPANVNIWRELAESCEVQKAAKVVSTAHRKQDEKPLLK